ncbi:MAG TPA: T9SS type A sorting domain-containing protein [Saprospiraceae bacterium]|nr:T9SS type A sorting domain-containing protein [Saprospiraceae bacterium]HMQ85721.1 T9SS type A sorting domain-containing protein [Saprospiraceae bacterium]
MTIFRLLMSCVLIIPTLSVDAQPFLDQINTNQEEPLSYKNLEASYLNWLQTTQLANAKGWKWYGRWMEEQAVRANPDGSFADQAPLLMAAIQKAKKQYQADDQRNPAWMPVGPNAYPTILDDFIIKGMGRINCITFHPSDANTFWVGVAQGGIWKTTNSGQSWTPLSENMPILRVSDIAVNPNNADEIYASVGDYAYVGIGLEMDNRKRHTHYGMGVYKTTDGGSTWSPTGLTFDAADGDGTLTRRVFVHPDNSQELIAAGIFGMKRSSDGGDNWVSVFDEMVWDIEQHPTDPNTLYASSAFIRNLNQGMAGIWKSTDFGMTWAPLDADIPPTNVVQRIELSISRSEPDIVYALACNMSGGLYGLFRTTDAGATWSLRADAPNIMHWDTGDGNGGQGTYDMVLLVHPENPDKVYAGGINIWASEDGGQSWNGATYWVGSATSSSIHADQHFLAHNPNDGYFYACNDGGVSRTESILPGSWDSLFNFPGYSFPTAWEDLAGGMQITSYYRLGLSRTFPGDLIAGAQDNSSWLKKSGDWYLAIGGDGMEGLIHPSNPNIVYGSWQFGNILKSEDGGLSFNQYVTDGLPGELSAWTTPFRLHPNQPNQLYVAYSNLYRTSNDGQNWEQLSDFPGTQTPTSHFAISETDPDYIYLARRIYHSLNAPSQLWRSINGGSSWQNKSVGLPDSLFFTYVSISPLDPNDIWVVVGGFVEGVKVFRSVNAGDDWENVSYDLPNVPVNCIVHDPNSAANIVYIGTDIGVYVSYDGLNAWQPYDENMPNVIVSELEILPEEQKIYAATFGRGIWEGNTMTDPLNANEASEKKWPVSLSPNPGKDIFQLDVQLGYWTENLNLEIVDVMGRIIWQQVVPVYAEALHSNVHLDAPAGLYFLQLRANGQRQVLKFEVR